MSGKQKHQKCCPRNLNRKPKLGKFADIKILNFVYPISWVKNLQENGQKLYGLAEYHKRKISINIDTPSKLRKTVIVHEICHALSYALDLNLTEHKVRLLSLGLLQAFKINI